MSKYVHKHRIYVSFCRKLPLMITVNSIIINNYILWNRTEYHLILSRRRRGPSWLNQGIFRKIEQDNWFIIQQILIHWGREGWRLREQGWRSGESTRLPPMGPGFDSRSRCNMWVEFVVGSRPCSERLFSGYSGFPLSSKTNTSKFQFDLQSPRLVVHLCTAIRLRL